LNAIHDKMHRAVQAGRRADRRDFLLPARGDADCKCRKPKPACSSALPVASTSTWWRTPSVGDSLRDLQAAAAVGASPLLVLTGKGTQTQAEGGLPEGTLVFPDLATAAEQILRS
jgi:D-glycero-D-manno-heptose 1,7-bisphosphate phosphatase